MDETAIKTTPTPTESTAIQTAPSPEAALSSLEARAGDVMSGPRAGRPTSASRYVSPEIPNLEIYHNTTIH